MSVFLYRVNNMDKNCDKTELNDVTRTLHWFTNIIEQNLIKENAAL
jgi:hypothetical protein